MLDVACAAACGACGTVVGYLAATRAPVEWRTTATLILTLIGAYAAGVAAFVSGGGMGRFGPGHGTWLGPPAAGVASLSSFALIGLLLHDGPRRRRLWLRAAIIVASAVAAAIAGYLTLSVGYFTYAKLPRFD